MLLVSAFFTAAILATASADSSRRASFGSTVMRTPSRLTNSALTVNPVSSSSASYGPVEANEDQFHISRVERVRYGKAFRPQALPLTADTTAPHSEECKYKKEPWQECDPVSKQQRRRLVLKKGNPLCEATKEIVRSCKAKGLQNNGIQQPKQQKTVVCRYKKGTWSECDAHTGLKTRTDTLKLNRHVHQTAMAQLIKDSCEPTRVMTRKCKSTKLGCKYNRSAVWSECDSRTNLRTKVLKLDPNHKNGGDCEAERRITKNCRGGGGGKNRATQASASPLQGETQDEDEDTEDQK